MSKYKGQIAHFPDEVVEWMLDQQVKQGNKRDVSVFEKFLISDYDCGGFDWDITKDGEDFCYDIIEREYFDLFFERYPKKQAPKTWIQEWVELIKKPSFKPAKKKEV